jgi:hypothetical protein
LHLVGNLTVDGPWIVLVQLEHVSVRSRPRDLVY